MPTLSAMNVSVSNLLHPVSSRYRRTGANHIEHLTGNIDRNTLSSLR